MNDPNKIVRYQSIMIIITTHGSITIWTKLYLAQQIFLMDGVFCGYKCSRQFFQFKC